MSTDVLTPRRDDPPIYRAVKEGRPAGGTITERLAARDARREAMRERDSVLGLDDLTPAEWQARSERQDAAEDRARSIRHHWTAAYVGTLTFLAGLGLIAYVLIAGQAVDGMHLTGVLLTTAGGVLTIGALMRMPTDDPELGIDPEARP